jgi:hypothetical protein
MAGHGFAVIDFGATPVSEGSFTISDANISAGMVIECWVMGGDSVAGQNDAEDHRHAAASWKLAPGAAGAGSFPLDIYCLIDQCFGQFKIRYAFSS